MSKKIQKVDDISNETASFTDDVTGSTDYTYYADGSLKSDANKGISLIEYNYLKLPKRIVKGSTIILNEYDAAGAKLKETIGTQVTDYVGNKIYRNNNLYQIVHGEGRIVNGEYEYNIKDHLGNLRVAFRDSLGIAKITQANSYGIFGEDLSTLSYLKPLWKEDKFKFTGKEDLPETGYTDFGARLYDKFVPRFTTIDPLAEISRRFSPYTYSNDNPIRFTDPDGMRTQAIEQSNLEWGFSTLTHCDGCEFLGGGDDKPKKKKENKMEYLGYNKEIHSHIVQYTTPEGSVFQSRFPFAPPGIEANFSLEAIVIPIFRPLGWAFNALKFKLFAKVVTNAEVENVVAEVVEESVAKGGRGALVNLTEETFSQALFTGVENVGGYSIYGTKGLVGSTFNRNIFLLEASGTKSLSRLRSLIGSLEAEALEAGANKISIYGSSVINKGFLNPEIAKRFGYTFEQSGSGVILQKTLKP
jgi:RHS repeat-associated protein